MAARATGETADLAGGGRMETTRMSVNMALISAIVAVATIGGLLFGYDSGAVNGTQAGLKTAFALDDAALGFTVGSLLISSEEHTSELQSLMRHSYAVFCLKKKKDLNQHIRTQHICT